MARALYCNCICVLFNRDNVDNSGTSWTGSTRISTESLPSKALSMTSSAVLAPVGDSEPLDRSISQPNIAGGLKLPAAVPPSPTVLASCSSTSSDLSRGGYASADSLGSVSSKDDMLSAPMMSDETQSLTTERSTRSASPCHENVSGLSSTLEERPVKSTSLSASLEPTPDLVLNLPTTTSESTLVTYTASPMLTSAAEMFASAEHGTIKKSGTPGRSSTSGEEGTGVDEVFPHTPVEIAYALEGDSFSFDMLSAPPPALTDIPEATMKSTDKECELLPDNLPDLPSERQSASHEESSAVTLSPCTVSLPSSSAGDIRSSCTEEPATVCESQSELTSIQIADSVTDALEKSSMESFTSVKIDDRSSEFESSDLVVGHPGELLVSEVGDAETQYKSAKLESVEKSRFPLCESSDLSENICSDVAMTAAKLQSPSVCPVNLHAALSSDLDCQEVVTSEKSSADLQPVAVTAVLPVDAASDSSSANDAITASKTPDVVHFPSVTSSAASSNTQIDSTVQSTTSLSSAELRPVPAMSPRPSSSPISTTSSVTVSPRPEVVESYHSTVERRSSESAVSTLSSCHLSSAVSPQSAISHLVLSTHKQAASVAVTSFPEPLPHRPPPSLAAHSAALQLLTQKHEPSTITATGTGASAETSAKTEQSPSDRPKSKPPPVKKKPAGPLKEKFFSSASGDHRQQ